MACHGFCATTPTKLPLTTTLTMPGKLADGALVDAPDGGADFGWTHDAAMQHAGHFDVVDELESARHHVAHVDARNGGTEHGPLARVLPLGCLIELEIESLAADQIAVRHASRRDWP